MTAITKIDLKTELLQIIRDRAVDPDDFSLADDPVGRCVIFNTESVHFFICSELFRAYVRSCRHLFLDGAALQLYLRLNGVRVKRFHGPDLLSTLLASGYFSKNSLTLIGSEETIQSFSQLAPVRFAVPVKRFDLERVGDEARKAKVESSPEFFRSTLVICLGLPKQELFASHLIERFEADENFSILPLGAAIDFATGVKQRSSSAWTAVGLEWLPRLIREPRMLKRIARSFRALLRLEFGVGG